MQGYIEIAPTNQMMMNLGKLDGVQAMQAARNLPMSKEQERMSMLKRKEYYNERKREHKERNSSMSKPLSPTS